MGDSQLCCAVKNHYIFWMAGGNNTNIFIYVLHDHIHHQNAFENYTEYRITAVPSQEFVCIFHIDRVVDPEYCYTWGFRNFQIQNK